MENCKLYPRRKWCLSTSSTMGQVNMTLGQVKRSCFLSVSRTFNEQAKLFNERAYFRHLANDGTDATNRGNSDKMPPPSEDMVMARLHPVKRKHFECTSSWYFAKCTQPD